MGFPEDKNVIKKYVMPKEPRVYSGERTVLSINGVGKTEQPQANA